MDLLQAHLVVPRRPGQRKEERKENQSQKPDGGKNKDGEKKVHGKVPASQEKGQAGAKGGRGGGGEDGPGGGGEDGPGGGRRGGGGRVVVSLEKRVLHVS